MQSIDMDKILPAVYSEGSVLFKIDYKYTTNEFGTIWPGDPGNLSMVMREPCEEYMEPCEKYCSLMSMEFNSFLMDEVGRIICIE